MTVFGAVPAELALRRDGARADDDIWVSGELGAADVAYRLLDGQYPADPQRLAATRRALEWPEPQVALGLALRGVARSAIDISDGLLQDLGHILAASRWARRWTTPACPWPRRWAACPRTSACAPSWAAVTSTNSASPRRPRAATRSRAPPWPPARASRASAAPRRNRGSRCGMRRVGPWTLPRGYDHFPAA